MIQQAKSRVSRRLAAAALVAAMATMAVVPGARADQVFHTERIPLIPVNGAPLQSGFVVDIHTNGPVISALEHYQLNGAMPNTTYQVVSQISFDPDCATTPLTLPDGTLQTNAAGNGELARTPITPDQVAGLGGLTIGINWQVLQGGAVVYQTGCIPVRLD